MKSFPNQKADVVVIAQALHALRDLEEQGNEIIMAARAHWFEDDASGSGLEDEEPAAAPAAETQEAAHADSEQ